MSEKPRVSTEAQATLQAQQARESNFDGLIGPTHNYSGLSDGNLASADHKGQTSYPKEAALQGLEKMRFLYDAGLWQGVLPPQQRPFLPTLRALGYTGSDRKMYEKAWSEAPLLMKNLMSASSMWAANAATVSPASDCADGMLHLTPANLTTMLHRAIEHSQTERALKLALPFAKVHEALPSQSVFADEGAANHVRLCAQRRAKGVELFVYGRDGFASPKPGFPARQSLQASQALARRHGLDPSAVVFARQSERAIQAGAFHNDVVCVGALQTLFFHEFAFDDTEKLKADLNQAAQTLGPDVFSPIFVEVSDDEVPLADAISAYLFNSMLVRLNNDGRLTLIAPTETRETESTRTYCERLVKGNSPISEVKYVDVRQSMQNGGGPACLRLRVTLTDSQWAAVNPLMKLTTSQFERLGVWVNTHYRDSLSPQDLPDPDLMDESFTALDELTQILGLGPDFYPFQRDTFAPPKES